MYENGTVESVKLSVANNKFLLTSYCSQSLTDGSRAIDFS